MSSTCAIVVCDHGLGHVRRCALMAKEREKNGENVTLFAPRASLARLQRAVPSVAGLKVEDFATRTSPERIRQGMPEAVEWLERLPALDVFDTVICDNLPELLALRPDSIISANFFWHDVIDKPAIDYVEYCTNLLFVHKPLVIGCEKFAMECVRKQYNFKPVSLYKVPELVAASEAMPDDQRTDLLVTGGSTSAVYKELQDYILKLMIKGPKPYIRIHVDPDLMPSDPPAWIVKADFSLEMYCRIKAAVCRPGLGVITDLLTVGAEIIPIFELGNSEMKHNADIISKIMLQ